jgi:carboxypeptidase PM20D1
VKRLAVLMSAALAGLALLAVFRALRVDSLQVPPASPAEIAVVPAEVAARLAGAVRIPTVSYDDPSRFDPGPLLELHHYLATTFPRVTHLLTPEVVGGYSLLYTWQGRRPDLPPLIFTAHLDVVPAPETATGGWHQPPFGGVIADGSVWGRGTLDDKLGVMGLLEAVDGLIAAGFTPSRTVYLAFGHDEEVLSPDSGAAMLAALLSSRGVHDAWLMDEGGIIYDHVPGVRQPVAFVGISEKTPVDIELDVEAAGGHSSMPPPETAVGILARALDRIETHPMPARLEGAARGMFLTLAPEMAFPMRAAFANLWLTRPLVLRQLAASPDTNAVIRTTMAPTMLQASDKSNVLPTLARAVINVRLLPGDAPGDVVAHLTRVIDDSRVKVGIRGSADPPAAPVSAIDTPAFRVLAASIRAVWPNALVAPYLTVGATDARHYTRVAPNTYRFLPIYQPGAVETLHGPDEHIQIDIYANAIRTYATIIEALSHLEKVPGPI